MRSRGVTVSFNSASEAGDKSKGHQEFRTKFMLKVHISYNDDWVS